LSDFGDRTMELRNIAGGLLGAESFTNIFKTFRFAIQPGKLIIALLAVSALFLAGMLMDLSRTVVTSPGATFQDISAAPGSSLFAPAAPAELHASLGGQEAWRDFVTTYSGMGGKVGVFAAVGSFSVARFDGFASSLATGDLHSAAANAGMLAGAIWWAAKYHTLYTAIYLTITLAVMAVAGGAICRSTALQFAKDEKPGVVESLRFSARRFTDFFTAPLWAAGVILLIGGVIFLMGLPGNIPFGVGPVAVGILSPIAMLLGVVMTLFIIGLIAGGSLMLPAVAYEGSDGMDAMGRAFGYVYMKPWRMGFYTLVAALYGAACYMFIRVFAYILIIGTRAFMAAGIFNAQTFDGRAPRTIDVIWPAPTFDDLLGFWSASMDPAEKIGAFLIRIPNLFIIGLIVAFVVCFFFSSSTIIYALMRKRIDGEGFGRIFTQAELLQIGDDQTQADSVDTK
jgi:hypothetical protein